MQGFSVLTSIAVPLLRDSIDTDIIIPSREIRATGRTGLADGLFAPWRYLDAAQRTPDPDFPLNKPAYAGASILLGGANFGSGSSREHAVWALAEYGIRAIIAQNFSPIFCNNAVRNGLLPVSLPKPVIEELAGIGPVPITIDLAAQSVTVDGTRHDFAIEEEPKAMLLEGLDAIDLTLQHSAAIAAWTASDRSARPWVYDLPEIATLGSATRA